MPTLYSALFNSAVFIFTSLFGLGCFASGASTGSRPSPITEAGGSNFAMIRQSEFMAPMSDTDRAACDKGYHTGDSRSVIGVYHIAKTQIDSQLEQMIRYGQKKISLVIWHYDNPWMYPDNMYCMNLQTHGILATQHQTNLRNLVLKIKELGFDQINVRFAPMDQSAPGQWSNWNEEIYQSNWNLIVNTRRLVLDALQASQGQNPRILFDLGLELGGIWVVPWVKENRPVIKAYVQRLWSNYTQNFGTKDTIGFSIVPAIQGMIQAQIDVFDQVGRGRPNSYGFDVYGDAGPEGVPSGNFDSIDSQFRILREEMESSGEISKEIFLQETYANSAKFRLLLDQAALKYQVPVRYIFQWPLEFGTSGANNVKSMIQFDAYLPSGN